MARKSGQVRQKSEVEQSRGKDVGEECGAPREKCAAKGGVIWWKRGTDNLAGRSSADRRK